MKGTLHPSNLMQTELNIENGRKAIHVVPLRLDTHRLAHTSCNIIRGTLGVMRSMIVARIVPYSQEQSYQ